MQQKLEELCTIKQACFSEKAGRTTIYKRINEGIYVAYKIGGSTRITIASLNAYRKTMESGCAYSARSTATAEGAHNV